MEKISQISVSKVPLVNKQASVLWYSSEQAGSDNMSYLVCGG